MNAPQRNRDIAREAITQHLNKRIQVMSDEDKQAVAMVALCRFKRRHGRLYFPGQRERNEHDN